MLIFKLVRFILHLQKKPGSPKKALSKKPRKMADSGFDVMTLSDQDLASMLRERGMDVGPIVGE